MMVAWAVRPPRQRLAANPGVERSSAPLEPREGSAEPSERPGEILGDRALESEGLAASGMRHGEALRVQGEPIQAELHAILSVLHTLPVANVSSERMVDAPQVTPDLMTPPGEWPRLKERKPHAIRHE